MSSLPQEANRRPGGRQVMAIIFCSVVGRSFITVPPLLIREAGYSAPLAVAMGLPIALLYLHLVMRLARRFPGQSVIQYLPRLAGKWGGRTLGLAFILFLVLFPAFGIRYMGEVTSIYFLELTPQAVTGLLFLLVVGALAYLGLEDAARFAQWTFLFVLSLLVPLVLFSANNFRWSFIRPVFPPEWSSFPGPVFIATEHLMNAGSLLLLFFPYFTHREVIAGQAVKGVLLAGMATIWIVFGTLATFGPATTGHFLVPSVEFVRAIRVPISLVEQPSMVFGALWIIVTINVIGIYLLAAAVALKQWLGVKNYRPVLAALLPLIYVLSQLPLVPQGILALYARAVYLWGVLVGFLPVFLLLLAVLRGQKVSS